MERNPPPGLRTIAGRWITIPKHVAIALRRLASRVLQYSVGEMFGVAACTSVITFKMSVNFFFIAAIPLHLK